MNIKNVVLLVVVLSFNLKFAFVRNEKTLDILIYDVAFLGNNDNPSTVWALGKWFVPELHQNWHPGNQAY